MERKQSSLHGRKNIYFKQPKNTRANPIEKLRTSRCRTSRTTKNAWANQEKLLVVSGSQEVDLASFISVPLFIFFSIFFPFVLFLACRTRIRGGMS